MNVFATIGSVRIRLGATFLVLGLAILMPAWGESMSRRPDRVAVSCDTEGSELLDQVCPILIDALNDASPEDVTFVADNGTMTAALYVRLETALAGRSVLRGRLHWRRSRSGEDTAEPEVTLTVSDGELTTWTVGNFARALANVSELPTSR